MPEAYKHLQDSEKTKASEVSEDRNMNPLTRQMAKAYMVKLDKFINITKEHILKTRSQIAELEQSMADKSADMQQSINTLKANSPQKTPTEMRDVYKEIDELTSKTKQKLEEMHQEAVKRICRRR